MYDWHGIGIDGVFAVCFTGNRDRHAHLIPELERVGLPEPYVVWGFPTPYDRFLLKNIPHIEALDKHPGSWGCTLSHYRAVKIAYELGYENALFMEDDCRYVKDLGKLSETLQSHPSDYDFLMLDSIYRKGVSTVNPNWGKCTRCCSTASYICNRRAMGVLINMYESPISGRYARPMMRNSDHWTDYGIIGNKYRIYFSNPNVAIQCRCPGRSNYGESVFHGYRKIGLDMDMYMPF